MKSHQAARQQIENSVFAEQLTTFNQACFYSSHQFCGSVALNSGEGFLNFRQFREHQDIEVADFKYFTLTLCNKLFSHAGRSDHAFAIIQKFYAHFVQPSYLRLCFYVCKKSLSGRNSVYVSCLKILVTFKITAKCPCPDSLILQFLVSCQMSVFSVVKATNSNVTI